MKLEKNKQNLQGLSQLVGYAFNKNENVINDPLFISRYEHADGFGIYRDEVLASALLANRFDSFFYNHVIPMAGVGYVASYPEYRGDGGIATCMNDMLIDMNKQGVVISMLAPFSQRFYRKFGYEQSIVQKTYHIPSQALVHTVTEKEGGFLRGKWTNQTIQKNVKNIYQSYVEQSLEVGTVKREDWWWQRLDKYYQNRHIVLAVDKQDRFVGYMIYRMIGDEFKVDEIVYTTVFGVKKLLTFLKGHQSSFKKFTYTGPIHEKLEVFFMEQEDLEIQIKPFMMSRVINFSKLLQYIPFKKTVASFVFEVTEDISCPWNVGKWQLNRTTSGFEACQVCDGSIAADLSGNINAWAELILGEASLENLLFSEKMFTTELSKVVDIFPKGKQSFYDYF